MSVESWKIESRAFCWEGGSIRPSSKRVSVVEPAPGKSFESGRGNLYILAESPTGDEGAEKAVIRVIQAKLYSSGTDDPEASLEAAIRAADEAALRRNSPVHVSVLLLKGSWAYLAQVGEALIGACVAGSLSWYSPLAERLFQPLGESGAQPLVSKLHLQESDAICIFSRPWLGVIDNIGADKIEPLLCNTPASEMPNALASILPADVPPLDMAVVRLLAPVMGEEAPEEKPAEGEEEKPEKEPSPPGPPEVSRPRGSRRRKLPILWIVVLIPLLVIAASAGLWWKHQKEQEARYQALVTDVRTLTNEAAQEGTSDDVARQKLQRAWDKSQEALQLRPNSQEVLALQEKIREAQDRINKVSLLYMPWKLREFTGARTNWVG